MKRHQLVRSRSLLARLGLLACAGALLSCGNGDGTPTPTPSSSTGGACSPVSGAPALTLRRIASGLNQPVDLQSAPGDRTRLFVLEQPGRIRVIRNGALVERAFLDIVSRVGSGGERGLLGLAFHPRYAENGRFFVNYTDRSGDTHIAEFRVTGDPEVADAGSERLVLFVNQPFSNHNGGGLAFGLDSKLYIGLGDGGSGGDPLGNGQNRAALLGKLLRIDVDGASPYTVPADNPFAGQAGTRGEIWALGLRNPWRFAFDRQNGDLYIGDVGQNAREEVDVGLAARRGGENYGWNITEGTQCYSPSSGCNRTGLTGPVLDYDHGAGCSITGGVLYRGCRMPGHAGTYFYGDFCTGFVRSFRLQNGQATDQRDWTSSLGGNLDQVSAFGADQDGEIYILDYDGEVYSLGPA